jgi:hypothetical protein
MAVRIERKKLERKCTQRTANARQSKRLGEHSGRTDPWRQSGVCEVASTEIRHHSRFFACVCIEKSLASIHRIGRRFTQGDGLQMEHLFLVVT